MKRQDWVITIALTLALPALTEGAASPLADAARQQDRAAIRALIKQKGDVNTPQPDGATALHWATHWDDMESVELLLSAGAAVNARNDYGVTPLSLAAENANLLAVQRLIKAGADVNVATSTGETPLMTAVRAGNIAVIKALIGAGANVNAKGGGREQTALHWAVAQKDYEVMRILIEAKADLDARTELRREFVSFSRGNPQGGRLTGIADHTLESDGSRPGLRWINKGGLTPLLFAARDGDLDAAKLLAAAGANLNATTGIGETALMLAAHNDHTEVALFLLDKGADPNAADIGYTALHAAVLRSDLELVKSLLAHKANPNTQITKGTPVRRNSQDFELPKTLIGATPYLLAAKFLEADIMRALAAGGADTRLPMKDGATPLMAAAGMGIAAPAQDEKRGTDRRGLAILDGGKAEPDSQVLGAVSAALTLGSDVNAVNSAGDTALHIASAQGYIDVVKLLAAHGADINVRNARGLTPLAVLTGRTGPKRQSMIDLLRSLGATE